MAEFESQLEEMSLLKREKTKSLFRSRNHCSKFSGIEDDHMDFEKQGLIRLDFRNVSHLSIAPAQIV